MSTTSTGWERWRRLDPRTPVVAGIGRAEQQPASPEPGKDALGLMVEATKAAGDDCGAPGLLRRIDRVAVPEGSWKYRDAARLVARAVGAGGARTVVVRAGIPQQTLLDDAYLDLLGGHLDVALVVGGEAAGRAAAARRAGIELDDIGCRRRRRSRRAAPARGRDDPQPGRDRARRLRAGAAVRADRQRAAPHGAPYARRAPRRDRRAVGRVQRRRRPLPARRVPRTAHRRHRSANPAPTTGRSRSRTTSGTARR